MVLSTTTAIVHKYRRGMAWELEQIRKAGYGRADVCLWDYCGADLPMAGDNWQAFAEETVKKTRELNLPVYQTHGDTASGREWDDPAYDFEGLQKRLGRCLSATAMLGAKWMVIHPMNLPREPLYNPQKTKEANLRFLAPHIELAKKLGIGIAVENMVDFRSWHRRYCGGNIFELLELVDTINDPAVGICLDTGHANLAGLSVPEAVRAIGGRLKCTHINDNRANGQDEHLFPFRGTVDWPETMRALKEIDYDGDFSYEAGAPKDLPENALDGFMNYTVALGRGLLNMK